MTGKRARWILLLSAVVAVGAIAGGLALWLRPGPAPTAIALVNSDTGPTGAKVVEALRADGAHEWQAVRPEEADASRYAAVITLPADLSTSVGSLATPQPRRTQVTVATNRDADPNLVNDAVNQVTRRISAAGMDDTLAAVASARGSMQQAAFTTQLLGAGVRLAADASNQFGGGADQMLGFLNTAKSGAGQLTSGIGQLNDALAAATTQANGLAGTLDATGVTIGQINDTAHALTAGLDQVLPLLRALPFAGDPRLADAIAKLDALHGISSQAGAQLAGFAQLTGSSTDPATPVGTLLRDAAGRLSAAGAQLNQGAELARQVPQLADQGAAQLTAAMSALTGGVAQLQQIVANLNTQTGKALTALPAHSSTQQTVIATNLSNPVDIVRE
ncbi:hypothetical protein NDR87_04635 [Nocardia sp. CDC159]|uniref:Uncharacterized protein n=1 Tax=Nocardia pulmonis TaxID=2951408 RepID=A0A9X2IXP0_9NOCA|nr:MULTISPECIES: hypothetical protein [Nocardia]MCM6773051.1 hypothetical protein [Nocardia pulmonis]MCM6785646.1 hypothetical protein [Nocardia sp. CDC159]